MLHKVLLVIIFLAEIQIGIQKTLVLLGGSMEDDNTVWDRIIELAGGASSRIGVITAASADPEDSWDYYRDLFLGKGAGECVWIPIHEGNKDANSDPEVIAEIQRMTGFFFGGGSQSRIINSFYNEPGRVESPALLALREQYDLHDAVMGGNSAGAACMGQGPMLTGGYSWEACVYGAYEMDDPDKPDRTVQYDPDGGIGMIRDFIVDSHFSARGREGRLARLIADTMSTSSIGVPYGIGPDEGTSLLITGVDTEDAWGEVIPALTGFSGVTIMDLSGSTTKAGQDCWHVYNITTHYVTEGDRIHLAPGSFQIEYAPFKQSILGSESSHNPTTSNDIFGGHQGAPGTRAEWPEVACMLLDTVDTSESWGRSREQNPRYDVEFLQRGDTEAYGGEGGSIPENFAISYRNLYVEISPEEGDENYELCGR